MIDQLNQVLGELNRLHADADRLIDQYIELICKRDGLNIPIPAVRLYQIENRAGVCMDARHALQLIRADLEGTKSAPANDTPSVPTLFQLESGVTADLSPREAARQLKERRK
jgi:hypothetical protein